MSEGAIIPTPAAVRSRYHVLHRTEYEYPQSVAVCQNEVRMSPRSFGYVECHHNKVTTDPAPTWAGSHVDYFGNNVVSFSIEAMHERLLVTSESEVSVDVPDYLTIAREPSRDVPWRDVSAGSELWAAAGVDEYAYPSPRIVVNEAMRRYGAESFGSGATTGSGPSDRGVVAAAFELTARIYSDFKYDPSATTVATPVAESFELRRGVCQDFAHVQIAVLRSIGLPAAYVSGYLRTLPPPGQQRLVGADESHAWCRVYGGPKIGWFDCDPTNASLAGTDHVPIAWGRDYADVTPMRGVVIGGGSPTMKVSVDVASVE